MKKQITIDSILHQIVARDETGNILAEASTYCNPAALAQIILAAETQGVIDWDNSQIANPDDDAPDEERDGTFEWTSGGEPEDDERSNGPTIN